HKKMTMKILILLHMLCLTPEILSCIWLDSHHPSCDDIKNGYVFNGSAASSLSLVIPSAREEHVGRYVCSNPEANTEHRDEKPEKKKEKERYMPEQTQPKEKLETFSTISRNGIETGLNVQMSLINLCGEEWKRRLEDAIEQTLEEAGKGQCPRVRRDD
ncbi:hypothetical protein BaRGS_00039183, partial [Batillaria attramentaria]